MVVHTFLESIIPKTRVIERLVFEHNYYDIAIQHVNRSATGISPHVIKIPDYL